MSEMFGFVTPEDKSNWEKAREANKAKPAPGTAKEMASKSLAPALDLAEKGVQAQLHGAQTEAQRGAQSKLVTRERYREQSINIDNSVDDSKYGPDF